MNERGLSLTELLITSTLLSLVSAILFGTVQVQSRVFGNELTRAAKTGEVRIGFQHMIRDIRRAGYDPRETGAFGVTSGTSTELRFTVDVDEDGVVDPSGSETFAYRFANGQLWRSVGGTQWRSLLRDLEAFQFVYRDCLGRLVAGGSGSICLVQLVLGTSNGTLNGQSKGGGKGGGGKGGSESLCFKEGPGGTPMTCVTIDTGPPLGAEAVESIPLRNAA